MKTLVNKANPQIRITAPEIIETSLYYVLDFANDDNTSETDLFKDNWTLVEEEPKHTEVWVEGRTIFEQDAKKPEVDLEKTIEEEKDHYFAIKDRGFNLDSIDVSVLARHFYELGIKEQTKK